MYGHALTLTTSRCTRHACDDRATATDDTTGGLLCARHAREALADDVHPCLECGRPLTHPCHLEDNVNGTKSRELFLCMGHPPTVFRRWQGILARRERCGRCGTSGLSVHDADDCDLMVQERLHKNAEG